MARSYPSPRTSPSPGPWRARCASAASGSRQSSAGWRGAMTEPGEAERFASETGVDCLAVAVGNVHGHYSGAPELDWARLEEVRERISVPLSLHGASGLPGADLERAVSSGVSKFNVNTELR